MNCLKKQRQNIINLLEFNNDSVDFDTTVEKREQAAANFTVNWTSIFTPIKDQGQCGSCWTFSAAGAVESNYYISKKLKSPVSLSEQQICDCAYNAGDGCNGGSPELALVYSQSGLETEASYPYVSGNTGIANSCNFTANLVSVKSKSYNYCDNASSQPCSLTAWQALLAAGPLSVVIEADSSDFQSYESGVLVWAACDCASGADHAVIAVGWGVDSVSGLTYILIRNSWGSTWGESGYFRVEYAPSYYDSCYVTGSAWQPTF